MTGMQGRGVDAGRGRIKRVISLGLGLALAALSAGGCASVRRADFDAALQENTELRARLDELDAARREAETRNQSLEQENRDLAARADQARTAPAGAGAGDAGFGGIAGVTSTLRTGGEVAVDVAGDVLFDSGSATIKASGRRTLDRVADVIRQRYAGNSIRVEGHTDRDPIRKSRWETNERLSGERAMAVEKYLVSRGIPADRIYYAGFGPARPKSSKRESRRVEIVILGRSN